MKFPKEEHTHPELVQSGIDNCIRLSATAISPRLSNLDNQLQISIMFLLPDPKSEEVTLCLKMNLFFHFVVFSALAVVFSQQVIDDDATTKFRAKLLKSGGACQKWGNNQDHLAMIPEMISVVGTGSFSVFTDSQGVDNELLANGSVMGNGMSNFSGGCAIVQSANGTLVAPWFMLPCSCSTQMMDTYHSLLVCDVRVPGKDGGAPSNYVCTGEYEVHQE